MADVGKERTTWELLDALRGESRHPSDFAVPLAAMIFLRWVDFSEAEAEAMAAFDESEYTPLLPAALHWRRWCEFDREDLPQFFGEELPAGIARLTHRHDPLAASLHRIGPAIRVLGALGPGTLGDLTDWLSTQLFETPNDRRCLLANFDTLLDRMGGRECGQFRTPACINDLVVALAGPVPGERLYDPCFGFAGNLTAACAAAQRVASRDFARLGSPPIEVAGVEINADAFVVGLARLVLAGVAEPKLELGNSLERESAASPRTEGFDLVVCNPPWGARIEFRGLDHFPVPTNDGTGLFIQHALSQLRPDGRAIIVVPQGFLFQQGKIATVRQWLLEQHRVEAVIGLNQGAFLPYAGVKASILCLRRGGGPTQRVRMVDGVSLFQSLKGSESPILSTAEIEALAAEVRGATPGKLSWDVDASLLAELGYDLSATRREATGLEQALRSIGKELPILALKEICRIAAGRKVPSSGLSAKAVGEHPVPYIRIGDLQRGETTKGSSWLTTEAVADLGPRFRLRAGCVLVSKSGTVGKAGVVRNGAVGGVASGGLFVLEPDTSRIDPHFLVAYLLSKDCQDWFASRSSGSFVTGLRKQFIEDLPLPVPPLPIQQRVSAAFRDHQKDAILTLADLLSPGGTNPLARWIAESLRILEAEKPGDTSDPSQVVRLKVFGRALHAAIAENDMIEEIPELQAWAQAMLEIDAEFHGSEQVPRGPALYGIFQAGLAGLHAAAAKIVGDSQLANQARDLTRSCIVRLAGAAVALQDDEPIEIQVLTETLAEGEDNEVAILVKNRGVMPLRGFSIGIPDGPTRKAAFLPESSEQTFKLAIPAPRGATTHTVRLHWEWLSLVGFPEDSEQEITFEVVPPVTVPEAAELGENPYFVSEPVGQKRTDIFFGREEVIAQIKRQIQSGNTVLLEGNRRAGKSSILKQLEGLDRVPGRLAVYSSMQASEGDSHVAGMPSEAVWRTLAKSVAMGLTALKCDVPLPDGTFLKGGEGVGIARACRHGISKEAPWEDFQEYVDVALGVLKKSGRELVLMIDEFDKLQEGIDNKVTSPQIPENIRYLIQSHPGFCAVLTGSRRMQRLRHEYWSALYGLGTRIGVSALEEAAARQLVETPVRGRLHYSDEAVTRLIDLAARQPFLIQSLCNRVFELAARRRVRSVTAKLVDEAADRFVEDNEHFASLMDYAETHRRRFLLMLVNQASQKPEPLTMGVLQSLLANERIEVSDDELAADLVFLRDLELIDFLSAEGDRYRITIPLMGRWLDAQHDYNALLAKARAEQENAL